MQEEEHQQLRHGLRQADEWQDTQTARRPGLPADGAELTRAAGLCPAPPRPSGAAARPSGRAHAPRGCVLPGTSS